jgi:hypothetical protein
MCCRHVLRTQAASHSGFLKARLGVQRPIAVDILLTIRWIVKLKGTHDEHLSEQRPTRRRNG